MPSIPAFHTRIPQALERLEDEDPRRRWTAAEIADLLGTPGRTVRRWISRATSWQAFQEHASSLKVNGGWLFSSGELATVLTLIYEHFGGDNRARVMLEQLQLAAVEEEAVTEDALPLAGSFEIVPLGEERTVTGPGVFVPLRRVKDLLDVGADLADVVATDRKGHRALERQLQGLP